MKIPIVNQYDEVIGHKEREEKLDTDIARATGVWVTNEKGEILLAQRGFDRPFHPGLWGHAAGGMVEEGESYESNALKEAEEEIGLTGIKLFSEYTIPANIGYSVFFRCFSTEVDSSYKFVKQDSEVEQVKWFTKEELRRAYGERKERFVPNFDQAIKHFFK